MTRGDPGAKLCQEEPKNDREVVPPPLVPLFGPITQNLLAVLVARVAETVYSFPPPYEGVVNGLTSLEVASTRWGSFWMLTQHVLANRCGGGGRACAASFQQPSADSYPGATVP